MQRVVVTGGCGLLGRYVVRTFAETYDVTVLDVKAPPKGDEHPGCRYHVCDVLDRQSLIEHLRNHDALIHLAGIDAATEAPDSAYFETNVLGTWNALHAAELAGHRKAVICSSISAIGLSDEIPRVGLDCLPADERQTPRPTHPYGLSKQIMETIGRSFAERGRLSVVALRPSLVIYPHILDGVLHDVGVVDANETLDPVRGTLSKDSLSPTRSYVRPDDVARCFRLALETDTGPYDDFYVLASDTYSPEPTLEGIVRRFGVLPPVVDKQLYQANPNAAALSNLKAQTILGWKPTGDWRALVETGGK